MTAAHLDYDALADLAEGILDEATATFAQRHLSECADCRDRAAEVAEVSRVLAEAPVPPMPAHLVERLDAAIAAEAAAYMPAHRHSRRFQVFAAAAAAAVVVGGGAVAARTVLSDGEADVARVSQPPPALEPSRPRPGDIRQTPMVARSGPYHLMHSGTNYTDGWLAAQVAAALTADSAAERQAMGAPDGALDGCVNRVGGGRSPLLVDAASYDGQPATVVVFPGGDAHHADVWVVGPRCSAADPALISHREIAR